MRISGGLLTGATAVSMTLAFSGSGWTQTVAERAALRLETEKQIAILEEKSAAFKPMNLVAETHGKMAAHQLEIARKLLALGNERAAKDLADRAEHALAFGPGKPIPQGGTR